MKGRITSATNELVYLANFLVEYERGGKRGGGGTKKQHKAGIAGHTTGETALPKELRYDVFSPSIV